MVNPTMSNPNILCFLDFRPFQKTEKTGMEKSVAYRYMMTLRDRGLIEYSGRGTLRLAEDLTYYRKYGSVNRPNKTNRALSNQSFLRKRCQRRNPCNNSTFLHTLSAWFRDAEENNP